MRIKLSVALVVVLMLSAGRSALGAEAAKVQISLDQTSIVRGEPLLLRWSITNDSDAPVALQLGKDGRSWYTIEVRGQSGQLVPALLPAGGEWHSRNSTAVRVLNPGAKCSDAHPFVMPLGALKSGHYTVIMRSNLMMQTGYDARAPGAFSHAKLDPIAVSLFILPDTDGALAEAAKRYAKRAKQTPTGGEPLIEALLAMPEGKVFAVWRDLVLSRDNWGDGNREGLGWLNRKLILDRLAAAASSGAADAVATVWNDDQQSDDVRVAAQNALIHMWWKAAPAVKGQIERAYTRRMGSMFDTRLEPGPPID